MGETYTLSNVRPVQVVWNYNKSTSKYLFTTKCFDNNVETYDRTLSTDRGTFLLNLAAIPSGYVLKSITSHFKLKRTDNASLCSIQFALGHADSLSGVESEQHIVTSKQDVPLSSHSTISDTSATLSGITKQQSDTILRAQYPILWLEMDGAHYFYEMYFDIEYAEAEPESKIYVGSSNATAVYVGSTKASAVYIGTTRVL